MASQASFPSLFLAAPTPESTPGKETVVPIPQSPQLRRGTRHPIPSASPGNRSQHNSAVGGGNRFPFFPLLLQNAQCVTRGFQPPTSARTGGPGRLTGRTPCSSRSPPLLSAVALIIFEHLLLKCEHQAKLQVENRNRTPR